MNIRRVIGLGHRHFPVLLKALLAVIAVRAALFFVKYRTIAKRIRLRQPPSGREVKPAYVTAWAVRHAARIVPRASCLTQALALQYLLAADGLSSVVRVGVRLDEHDTVHAHAWLLHDDIVLIGGTQERLGEYKPLTDLAPAPVSDV
jgi:hypothetical protein